MTTNHRSLQTTTGGMFNPATFNHHQQAASNDHHQHLKAASQAQPSMMQQQQQHQSQQHQQHQQQQNAITNNNNTDNIASSVNNVRPLSPNTLAAYHYCVPYVSEPDVQLAHSHVGHNNPQINHGHYMTNVMNSNHHHHQLLTGQIPLTSSMVPQTRLVGGTIPANDLSTLSNSLPAVATSASVASFMSVNGQSNNFRPASSQTSSSTTKKSSSSSTSKNGGDSPRRTFACPTCGKGFTEKFNMKRHMQIHSQTRTKFICNECSKSFAWKDNFIRHKKAAHGNNNSIQYQA